MAKTGFCSEDGRVKEEYVLSLVDVIKWLIPFTYLSLDTPLHKPVSAIYNLPARPYAYEQTLNQRCAVNISSQSIVMSSLFNPRNYRLFPRNTESV